ncbi:MAG: DUF1080 domain-containing protein [Planctomycetota bacterium]
MHFPAELTQDEILDGWISLFDGRTLFGWKPVYEADWKVKKGEIQVSSGERGLLRTTSQFDDFEMVLFFKTPESSNSGVFIRTSPDPKDVLSDCYEINIVSSKLHKYSTGAIVARAKTDLEVEPNEWHQMRVLADGPKIKVWIDGEKATEFIDPKPIGRGYIGLQFNEGDAAFKDISIKPLNQKSLFDGSDLEQWNTDQALESRFKLTDDQALSVLGGRGQIESKDQFGDCIISLQCQSNAKGLNSGLFFRCIPGDLMNGYESQIQNEFEKGDRRKPKDCGTGGIFRRSNARRVNADDQTWFAKTIIATGPHISVWVNGYQVTDWTDQRMPHENPRNGYRAEAGTIILQGHDPTTDLLFKSIRAKELSPRKQKQ